MKRHMVVSAIAIIMLITSTSGAYDEVKVKVVLVLFVQKLMKSFMLSSFSLVLSIIGPT